MYIYIYIYIHVYIYIYIYVYINNTNNDNDNDNNNKVPCIYMLEQHVGGSSKPAAALCLSPCAVPCPVEI